MSACCNDCCALDASRERQARTLRAVLAINAIMFVVIVAGAVYARSAALLSDSLDNLGDAVTYALSLYAVALGAKQKARVAVFKGILILEENLLKLCLARPGDDRPTEASSQEGSGHILLVLEPTKSER